ncbi:MAG: nucleotidyl transferase AbiEii/AbiGii toxin family protein [Candidatus Eisenbacteria bacterium]|uniref:Nucleotidyl transferase AbiEii/AbiGii toxin family protein n=1 Tax=Eiseniibacteriota bacterium TaxID=2212470 RepID=A0A933SDH4_UNCEI|nr:nucleotidyl transferase AbiEii/AbiGii toxin family protein [Candidatus Eisenbacteria bacterium]
MDFEKVLELLAALHRHEVEYVLVGGLAINLHGFPRVTQDVDLFLRPEAGNIERLRAALRELWNDPEIEQILVEDLAGDFPAVRYVPPDESVPMDLLARLGEAFRYEDIEWELREYEGSPVRLATPRMLWRMKKDTVRLHDRADAQLLRDRFGIEEE